MPQPSRQERTRAGMHDLLNLTLTSLQEELPLMETKDKISLAGLLTKYTLTAPQSDVIEIRGNNNEIRVTISFPEGSTTEAMFEEF